MLNRCEAAWDEPVQVRAQPLAVPGAPFQALDGGWVFPLPPDGALVLLSQDGTETLVLGTDPEVVVPNVVALAYRAAVAPAGRRARSARHAAAQQEDRTVPSVPEGAPHAVQATPAVQLGSGTEAAVPRPAAPLSVASRTPFEGDSAGVEGDSAEAEVENTVLGFSDDRTVTGSDLHRLLAQRAGAGPDTPEEHTVLGSALSLDFPTPDSPSDTSPASISPVAASPDASAPDTTSPDIAAPDTGPEQSRLAVAQPMQAPTPGSTMVAATLPVQLPVPAPAPLVEHPGQRPPVVRVADCAGETEIPLDAAMVVGTEPAGDSVRYRDARLVPVHGPTVSRSHACLRVQSGVVLVCDLWSTNGTRIKMPGQAPFRLRDGEEVPVSAGTVVELGDGVTLTVPALSSSAVHTATNNGRGGHGA